MRVTLFGALAALALGACVQSTDSGQTTATSGEQIGIGEQQVDGLVAMSIFGDICVKTSPSFRNAPASLAKLPFRQNPETGTYYHQNLDLSVKLMPKQCSMVFTSRQAPNQLGILAGVSTSLADQGTDEMGFDVRTGASSTMAKNGTKIEFRPIGRQNGRNWFRMVAIAP